MLRNELPPPGFHQAKRERIDSWRFKDQKPPRFEALGHSGYKSFWRVDVLNDMKTGYHVKIAPGERLDHVVMDRSRFNCGLGEARVWFDSKNLERFLGHSQEIAARTP